MVGAEEADVGCPGGGAAPAATLCGSDGLFSDCETAVYLGGDKARSAHGMGGLLTAADEPEDDRVPVAAEGGPRHG